MAQLTVENRYQKLVTQIEEIYWGAQQESKKRVNQVILEAYRKIGRQIVEVEQRRQIRAAYGDGLIDALSADLTERFGSGFSSSNLRYMRQFYLAYRDQDASPANLPWTHYRSLLTIKDSELREYYERQASEHDWSARDLDRYLKLDKVERDTQRKSKKSAPDPSLSLEKSLTVVRGKLHTYSVCNAPLGNVIQSPLMIDCGFRFLQEMKYPKIGPLKNGDIVHVKRKDSSFSVRRCSDQDAPRFFYKAVIERIVDGQTILCLIDVGFQNWTRQKIRLHQIDVADVNTQRGHKAKAFLQETLRECQSVVLNTFTDDTHMYSANVFYLAGEENTQRVLDSGRLINQDLVDLGLATIV